VFWLVEVIASVDLGCLSFDDALSFLVTLVLFDIIG